MSVSHLFPLLVFPNGFVEFFFVEVRPEGITKIKLRIADIKVEGVKNYEDYVLIGLSGLSVGQTITVPGDEITLYQCPQSLDSGWKDRLFGQ